MSTLRYPTLDALIAAQRRETVLNRRVKGMPGDMNDTVLSDIGLFGWNVFNEDLPLPVMVIKASALEGNIVAMQRWCDQRGVLLAPHGKTTMAPQIFQRQLEHGAWAISVATPHQLQVCRDFGIQRLILANQLVGDAALGFVCHELERDPALELLLFVDSEASVGLLDDAARRYDLSRPVDVLLEIGYEKGRSGIRSLADAHYVANAVRLTCGRVRLRGVTAFEGLIHQHNNSGDGRSDWRELVDSYLADVADVIDDLAQRDVLPVDFIISAGGSAAFDHVVRAFGDRWPERAQIVLRSGCYVTHDHGLYAHASPLAHDDGSRGLVPALELWSYVHSRPEPRLALLTVGRRDAPDDSGLPIPLGLAPRGTLTMDALEGCAVTTLNDHHAYMSIGPGVEVNVGDRVVLGISHPCTAFDKWRVVPVVDDAGTVIDAVVTYF